MTRWNLITSDEYINVSIECIIRSRGPVIAMRKEISEFVQKLRDELLHGDQGIANGCGNRKCKVCYGYVRRIKKKIQHNPDDPQIEST